MIAEPYDLRGKCVWVAGHTGMVGSAIVRRLTELSVDCRVLTTHRAGLDLRDWIAVKYWMRYQRPDVVILAAAVVGGIGANAARPVDFLLNNLLIETNVIRAAWKFEVERLLFLGSSCVYPPREDRPIIPADLMSAPLESTNEWYAVAKIAGIKLCQAYRQQFGLRYISAMPCNLYGPGDNFDAENGHVIPALIRKFHDAKVSGADSVTLWGDGMPLREFMHVDDCASALIHVLQHYDHADPINIGTGHEVTIDRLALMIAEAVGYPGLIAYDSSKPNGARRKLLDSSVLHDELEWLPKIRLADGLEAIYASYLTALKRGTLRTSTATR